MLKSSFSFIESSKNGAGDCMESVRIEAVTCPFGGEVSLPCRPRDFGPKLRIDYEAPT
jgi:hypothetical protein